MLSKQIQICFFISIILSTFQARLIQPTKVKRGIWGTVTSTISRTIEEKHYVPSTCIHLEPNLPDCRNVRFLNFPATNFNGMGYFQKSFNERFTNKNDVSQTRQHKPESEASVIKFQQRQLDQTVHVLGWAEFLGLTAPTVTVTEIKIVPTTVLDPRIVVTYAIKGCKPENLPTTLKKCPEEDALNLVEILPTSASQVSYIANTKVPENIKLEKLLASEAEEISGTVEGDESETTTLLNSSVATPQL